MRSSSGTPGPPVRLMYIALANRSLTSGWVSTWMKSLCRSATCANEERRTQSVVEEVPPKRGESAQLGEQN